MLDFADCLQKFKLIVGTDAGSEGLADDVDCNQGQEHTDCAIYAQLAGFLSEQQDDGYNNPDGTHLADQSEERRYAIQKGSADVLLNPVEYVGFESGHGNSPLF